MYWDGNKVGDVPEGIYAGEHTNLKFGIGWQMHALVQGGHTLAVEWQPPQEEPSNRPPGTSVSAAVEDFGIVLDKEFSTCIDTQGCLQELDKHDEAGKKLRSNNLLLRKCLKRPLWQAITMYEVGVACVAWRKCLRLKGGKTREQRLAILLSAAALGAVVKQDGVYDDKPKNTCMNPQTEDAMSWDCDCFEDMQRRCNAIGATSFGKRRLCFTAHFCLNPDVCKGWKDVVCHGKYRYARKIGPMIASVQARLPKPNFLQSPGMLNEGESGSLHTQLMARSSADEGASANASSFGLERTVGRKECH
eukprot:gnl/TRDRNA2_/TRDRNA2_166568_c0_seq1.p1 gnl/TRDRNA2_/TRDRNA2_166568_c0~~gnl/TRDRNA2_/TRDRNA2_166568_c0_seq1.p1  ORF type:complete len:319 (-),score=39.39 gnl/TRDRNA2_/TRDRNA2_166568_c0_seq1:230-1144(-)